MPDNIDYQKNYDLGNIKDYTSIKPLPNFIKDIDIYNTYNVNRVLAFDYEPAVKGIPYIFITTPNLNLIEENISNDSFLTYLANFQPELLQYLSYGTEKEGSFKTTSPFIKLLSNLATGFSSRDSISRTKEIGENFYGGKLTFPSSNIDSINGEEFSINFIDIKDLPVLKLFNAWFLYHNKVRHGELFPKPETIEKDECDFTCSVYYFITEMDGETLMYWEKNTGCAPLSVPFSIFSQGQWNDRDIVQFAINFSCAIHGEPMDPEILSDFNRVSLGLAKELNYEDEAKEKVYFEVEEKRRIESLLFNQKASLDVNNQISYGYYTVADTQGENFIAQTSYEDNGYTNPIVIASYMKPQVGKDSRLRFKLKFLNDTTIFTGK